jgi:aromatic ring-cleaving dioxygenase
VLLLENAPKRVSPVEWALYGISFVANTYATWLFNFTDYLKQQ